MTKKAGEKDQSYSTATSAFRHRDVSAFTYMQLCLRGKRLLHGYKQNILS